MRFDPRRFDLARSMGGGLAVQSKLEHGSTFVLTLPRAE